MKTCHLWRYSNHCSITNKKKKLISQFITATIDKTKPCENILKRIATVIMKAEETKFYMHHCDQVITSDFNMIVLTSWFPDCRTWSFSYSLSEFTVGGRRRSSVQSRFDFPCVFLVLIWTNDNDFYFLIISDWAKYALLWGLKHSHSLLWSLYLLWCRLFGSNHVVNLLQPFLDAVKTNRLDHWLAAWIHIFEILITWKALVSSFSLLFTMTRFISLVMSIQPRHTRGLSLSRGRNERDSLAAYISCHIILTFSPQFSTLQWWQQPLQEPPSAACVQDSVIGGWRMWQAICS